MRWRTRWVLAAGTIAVCTASHAQYDDSPLMRHADFYSHSFHQKFLNDLVDPLKGSRKKPAAAALSSGAATANAGVAPARLSAGSAQAPAVGKSETAVPRRMASGYPQTSQPEVEKFFSFLLSQYPKWEKQSGYPTNDMGAAVALFLAGSWMAYRDRDMPEEYLPTLATQMRGLIGSNDQLNGASPQVRREVYEQMAILGTFLTLTRMGLKRTPNPSAAANMRTAGKRYLEDFLKTDADRVQITAQGLVLN